MALTVPKKPGTWSNPQQEGNERPRIETATIPIRSTGAIKSGQIQIRPSQHQIIDNQNPSHGPQ